MTSHTTHSPSAGAALALIGAAALPVLSHGPLHAQTRFPDRPIPLDRALRPRRHCRHHRPRGGRGDEPAARPADRGRQPAERQQHHRRQAVASAKPDGHTLLLMSNGNAVSVGLFKKLPYDTRKDFVGISTLGYFDIGLFAPAGSRFNSLKDTVAFARANPGKLNIGSISAGSTQHLAAKMFETVAGLEAVIVPYKGSPAVVTALRTGEIDLAFEILGPMLPQVQAGVVKALAVSSDKRNPALPEVPTAIEAGVPGYNVASWNALAAPAGTSPAVIELLNRAAREAVESPAVRDKLAKLGMRVSAEHTGRARAAAGERDRSLGRRDPRGQDPARIAAASPSEAAMASRSAARWRFVRMPALARARAGPPRRRPADAARRWRRPGVERVRRGHAEQARRLRVEHQQVGARAGHQAPRGWPAAAAPPASARVEQPRRGRRLARLRRGRDVALAQRAGAGRTRASAAPRASRASTWLSEPIDSGTPAASQRGRSARPSPRLASVLGQITTPAPLAATASISAGVACVACTSCQRASSGARAPAIRSGARRWRPGSRRPRAVCSATWMWIGPSSPSQRSQQRVRSTPGAAARSEWIATPALTQRPPRGVHAALQSPARSSGVGGEAALVVRAARAA